MARSPIVEQARPRLTNPQWAIYEAGWQPDARFRYAVCGRRFGKTFLATEEIRRAVRMAVKNNVSPDNEIWYGAPIYKQAKRVFWRRLKRSIPQAWIDGKANETETYIPLKSGHIVRLVGLDNYDDLRGSGLYFFLGDEWADCPYVAWLEVIRPMLATAKGHALFIGTPKGFDHFRDGYIKGQGGEPDHKSFLFTTEDGGNVDREEITAAERELDPRSFRQEYRASFETYSGRVVYSFNREGSVRPCPIDPKRPLHIGMDFNVNPMSATIWQMDDDGETVRQVGEILLPSSSTDEMCDEIARRFGRLGFDGGTSVSHITVYPDPAGHARRSSAQGRTDIGILYERGFEVLAMSSHPLVRDRINVTNARFENAAGIRRAFVDASCSKSIEAYERHAYKEGTNTPDKGDGFDHLVDATGYFLFGRFAYQPPTAGYSAHMER